MIAEAQYQQQQTHYSDCQSQADDHSSYFTKENFVCCDQPFSNIQLFIQHYNTVHANVSTAAYDSLATSPQNGDPMVADYSTTTTPVMTSMNTHHGDKDSAFQPHSFDETARFTNQGPGMMSVDATHVPAVATSSAPSSPISSRCSTPVVDPQQAQFSNYTMANEVPTPASTPPLSPAFDNNNNNNMSTPAIKYDTLSTPTLFESPYRPDSPFAGQSTPQPQQQQQQSQQQESTPYYSLFQMREPSAVSHHKRSWSTGGINLSSLGNLNMSNQMDSGIYSSLNQPTAMDMTTSLSPHNHHHQQQQQLTTGPTMSDFMNMTAQTSSSLSMPQASTTDMSPLLHMPTATSNTAANGAQMSSLLDQSAIPSPPGTPPVLVRNISPAPRPATTVPTLPQISQLLNSLSHQRQQQQAQQQAAQQQQQQQQQTSAFQSLTATSPSAAAAASLGTTSMHHIHPRVHHLILNHQAHSPSPLRAQQSAHSLLSRDVNDLSHLRYPTPPPRPASAPVFSMDNLTSINSWAGLNSSTFSSHHQHQQSASSVSMNSVSMNGSVSPTASSLELPTIVNDAAGVGVSVGGVGGVGVGVVPTSFINTSTTDPAELSALEGTEETDANGKTHRVYKCPKPYCSKVYKNSNGLKYHLERGSCELDYSSATELDPSDPGPSTLNIKITHRPYWCRVNGCGKRYKNLNGLK
ncbi:hypothetical protein HK102_008734, partial [Quaeritorhiza haematococci]